MLIDVFLGEHSCISCDVMYVGSCGLDYKIPVCCLCARAVDTHCDNSGHYDTYLP